MSDRWPLSILFLTKTLKFWMETLNFLVKVPVPDFVDCDFNKDSIDLSVIQLMRLIKRSSLMMAQVCVYVRFGHKVFNGL